MTAGGLTDLVHCGVRALACISNKVRSRPYMKTNRTCLVFLANAESDIIQDKRMTRTRLDIVHDPIKLGPGWLKQAYYGERNRENKQHDNQGNGEVRKVSELYTTMITTQAVKAKSGRRRS